MLINIKILLRITFKKIHKNCYKLPKNIIIKTNVLKDVHSIFLLFHKTTLNYCTKPIMLQLLIKFYIKYLVENG